MPLSAARPGSPVIGREAELAVIAGFLEAPCTHAKALLLEGGAGIGKTTLVRVGLERARAAGLQVLYARPSAGEVELPYAGLGDLLAEVGDDGLASLAAPQREAVEVALGRARGTSTEQALSRGLLELFQAGCADGRLLVVVDDVQWLDRPTASALTFALRRLASAPLRALLAVRSANGGVAEPPLGAGDWEDVLRLPVFPMSATELGVLLRDRLGVQAPRPRLEALHRASAGNPMFALELARRSSAESLEGTTLASTVAEQVQALDADAAFALSYAAAALRPSSGLLLAAGVGRAHLRAALAARVLELEGDRLSFAHPLFGSVAYDLLLPDERREIHSQLAEASSDPVERGHHISRAVSGRDAAAAEAVEAAADAASARGDHALAASLLLRATELALDTLDEAPGWREARAADELLLAGDVQAAIELSHNLVERLPAGVVRAQALRTLFACAVGSGVSYEDGRVRLALALEEAEGDEVLQAELHTDLAEIACGLCRLEEAVAEARAALELAERACVPETAVAALAVLGFAESMLGQGVPESARAAFARWDGSPGSRTSPRMELACACMHATAFEEAEQLLGNEIEWAAAHGLEPVEVVARGHLAETQLRAGKWAEALANARLASEHARQAADAQIIAAAACITGMVEAVLGNHEQARALVAASLAEAEAMADFWWTIGGRAVLGLVALAEDDAPAAVEVLEPAWALMLERRLGDLSIFPVAHVLGEALIALGRRDDALAIAENLRACPVGEKPWCRVMASRLAALATSGQGHHETARREIETALEAHTELPEPFEYARTLQIAGRIERSARNWGAARSRFVDALERFDELGAGRWSEKAAADLARLPGRRPADRRTLTTREREIASLVASGLTNKEVAARLYLSVSTVEACLSKLYAKLGVRSRTELARRLGEASANL